MIDPIRFEVVRNALVFATEEMAVALRRSAYSTNVKTRGDFSCGLFDRDLRIVAQSFSQPAHLGLLATLVARNVRAYGIDRLGPGDGILVNDPFSSGSHLNDITLISPIYHRGVLYGFVANLVHQQLPDTTTLDVRPTFRQGRIYLDHTRNSRGQACAAPYSARPHPGATVSTPLKWSEVRRGLDPSKFTIKTLPRRIEKVGDLWAGVLGPGVDLVDMIGRLERMCGTKRR